MLRILGSRNLDWKLHLDFGCLFVAKCACMFVIGSEVLVLRSARGGVDFVAMLQILCIVNHVQHNAEIQIIAFLFS